LLTVEFGIAKTNKYASRDSGDTAEIVERPGGGLSVVLVDGQGSGAAAKLLSNALSSKAVALLKEGARDGAVARATHDYLHHYRGGQVSATLDIVSVDLVSQTIVTCRNNPGPMLVRDAAGLQFVASQSGPIGPHRHTRPEVRQFPLAAGTQVIVFTDGIANAGRRTGALLDLCRCLAALDDPATAASRLADEVLAAALAADQGRANDDMTVVAITIHQADHAGAPLVRRMTATLPLDGLIGPRR
jgi:serine phosphatase RsbU (regulator of sigma subunit)